MEISVEVRPRSLDGVIFSVHGKGDFVVLQLVEGKVCTYMFYTINHSPHSDVYAADFALYGYIENFKNLLLQKCQADFQIIL